MSTTIDYNYFEHILAYKLLTDEQYVATVKDHLDISTVGQKCYRDILPIIFGYFDKCNKLPNLSELRLLLASEDLKKSFADYVRHVTPFKNELFDQSNLMSNTESYIRSKNVYSALESIIHELQDKKCVPADIVEKIQKSVNIDLSGSLGIEIFNDIQKIALEMREGHDTFSSGWRWLDERLKGGWMTKGRALYLFAGTVNVGKSIFLGNIAINAVKQGKNVLLVSLEMSETMYASRLCSGLTGIPIVDLDRRTDDLINKVEALGSTETLGKLYIKEFPPSSITPSQLHAYIKRLKSSGAQIDMIVIDYLNLLTLPTNGDNTYIQVKKIAEQVRALSYIFNCPIVSASQLSRGAYNTEAPGMEHMSESNGTNATADFIGAIWKDEDDEEYNRVRLTVAKNRFGRVKETVVMNLDYTTLTLSQDTTHTVDETDSQAALDVLDKLGELS